MIGGTADLIGTAADLLRVPAAAADLAGTVPRSDRCAAETAALLAPAQGRRPGRARGGSSCGLRDGAARMRERDARFGTIGDGAASPAAHPRPHAGPVPQPLRIGAAADPPPSRLPPRRRPAPPRARTRS